MKILCAVLLLLIAASSVFSANAPVGDWSELIDVTQLPYFKDGVVKEVSSFDRSGGNDDGFSGKSSFIRMEGDKFVIFDEQGPGCIYRVWSANPGKGRIQVFFDGEATPRIDIPHWEEMFQGKHEPFMPPVSQNYLGGWCSYVPIPFAKSCRVVADGPVRFVQLNWQKFPADRQVKTFSAQMTGEEKAQYGQVKAAWSKLGDNPWPVTKKAHVEIAQKTIAAGKTVAVADLHGPGMVRSLRIKMDSTDARAWRKAVLEVRTDNAKEPNVWSPVGDFFLDGFGQGISQSLMLGRKAGTYYCYYPMPFGRNITIRIANQSKTPLKIDAEVVWEPLPSKPNDMGRFYAWWHRQNPTKPGELFSILDATGRGHWLGVSHAMQGTAGLGFLEGDEMAWIDGRDNTTYNGTGTEDYFDSGWYFGGTGNAPLYGCGVFDPSGSKCLAFRMHITDYVPFQHNARIGIEHGTENTVAADYAGVTYWYGESNAAHGFKQVGVDERMPQSPRMPGTVEAENVIVGGGQAPLMSDAETPFLFSAGRAVCVKSTGTPPSVTLKVETADSADCALYGQLAKGPDGGMVRILVDGKPVADSIDTRSPEYSLLRFTKLADLGMLEKGAHEIKFEMQKSSAKRYELIVDCVRLSPVGLFEAESMKLLNSSGGQAGPQEMKGFGPQWSGNSQVLYHPSGQGGSLSLELPVDKAGAYALSVYLTKAPDYGIVQMKVDGKAVGAPFDGYDVGVTRSNKISLGTVELTAGNHEIAFEVVGKNDKSTGYLVGVDAVMLR